MDLFDEKTGDEKVDIFFDGSGKPDGKGHDHIVPDNDNNVTYYRGTGTHADPDIDYGETGNKPVIK